MSEVEDVVAGASGIEAALEFIFAMTWVSYATWLNAGHWWLDR